MTTSATENTYLPGRSRFDFTGRVVAVTGATRGIGAEIAHAFAVAGARLVIHGRDSELLAAGLKQLDAVGAEAVSVSGDVRDTATARALVDTAMDRFGGVDVLVNNAGGNFPKPLEELSENGWQAIVETNLTGVFRCSQAVFPVFASRGGGCIVNIGSVAGDHAHPHRAAYGAAKAAVASLTKTMAWEWAPEVRVNCVAPGAIRTDAARFADSDVARATTRHIPMSRLGTPADVANACLFLSSDAAAFITGTTLRVDGGPLTSIPGDAALSFPASGQGEVR